MAHGTPNRVTTESTRRSEKVRVVVELERGALEDLELLVRYRRPKANRSEIVREAVSWLVARKAMQLVRARDIEARHAERAAIEREATTRSRQERDVVAVEDRLTEALRIAGGGDGNVDA